MSLHAHVQTMDDHGKLARRGEKRQEESASKRQRWRQMLTARQFRLERGFELLEPVGEHRHERIVRDRRGFLHKHRTRQGVRDSAQSTQHEHSSMREQCTNTSVSMALQTDAGLSPLPSRGKAATGRPPWEIRADRSSLCRTSHCARPQRPEP